MALVLERTVTSTEFQTRAGQYLDQAGSAPVIITKHRRPVRVLVAFEEFERLQELAKDRSTREARRVEDLGADIVEALEAADYSHIDPELNKLMD